MYHSFTDKKSNLLQPKRIILVLVLLFSVFTTCLLVLFHENSPQYSLINIFSIFGFGVFMFAWCHYDSLERDQPLSPLFRFLLVFLGVFGLIFYLFRSRGFKQGMLATGKLLLFWIGVGAVSVLTGALVWGITNVD